VKLKIKNINCSGLDDVMKFQIRNDYNEYEGYSGEWLGCYEYSGGFAQRPAGLFIYHWQVTRNNQTSHFYDSLFVAANDTATIVMNY
jgi:hypothetical protein